MKKVHRSSSARKSHTSSRGSFFSGKSFSRKSKPLSRGSLFSKKPRKSISRSKSAKPPRDPGRKIRSSRSAAFVKPPNDPGPKIREELLEETIDSGSPDENGEDVQQYLQNTGSGCLGSITGIIKLVIFGGLAVLIILIVRCGGC